jgi:deoxyhypusine synthase
MKAKRQTKRPEDINAALAAKKGPVSKFIAKHYRHFNAAALLDAAKGYEAHLSAGGKMLVTVAGAMSTAELGISLAEMIRRDKIHAIVCTGANLEEDIFNLVAHDYYERVPHYRQLTPADEVALLDRHMNRVTDTCIPEMEAIAGDFPICVVPMLHQDLQRTGVPLWGYFAQISDSTTSYGSYSGAVPNEKITWGKLGRSTPKFVVESDATIVAPLIFSWVLGQ